ncbi:hypothetical protein SELMODRAFT_445562 [Selaginella moellendorffii]|uniref:Pentatricopeptide repeat-containing protein n=1 Tax=Selaginella moellendorffii TaxID=88036 RepID=D8SJK4_SELML|nr:hypothetical protein SELMODRAFT_445562 [Selaginella moellendorffii]
MFERMPYHDVVAWAAMVHSYALTGHTLEVFEVFQLLLLEGETPDDGVFVSVLTACSHRGFYKEGLRYFKAQEIAGKAVDSGSGNHSMYVMLGNIYGESKGRELLQWLLPFYLATFDCHLRRKPFVLEIGLSQAGIFFPSIGNSSMVIRFEVSQERKKMEPRVARSKVGRPEEQCEDQVSCKEACCSCCGGLTGICAAFCCCPLTILPLAGFVCVKIPAKLAKRFARRLRKQPSRKLWRMGSSERGRPVSLNLFGSGRIQGGDEQLRFVESVGFGNSGDWREYFGGGSRRGSGRCPEEQDACS